MIHYYLPDGKELAFDQPVNGAAIAAKIGPGLAKAAVAIKVDGVAQDMAAAVAKDKAKVEILTLPSAGAASPEVLALLRHDCAHVMAEAVQSLFPGTRVTFGPSTDDGFYYDFATSKSLSTDDFPAIEKKMAEIMAAGKPFIREEWSRDQAVAFFTKRGEDFKAAWVKEIPSDEALSIYRQGAGADDWLDLCRGPHAPSTAYLAKGGFKLMKLSGAYWRGDANNAPLQRIYGTWFPSKKELENYLNQLAEAEKRDHRKIGKQLELFHFQEEAVGSVFWHDKGYQLWQVVEKYIRDKQRANGYKEIKTPQLVDKKLWVASGHWEKFGSAMFVADVAHEETSFALKPMNCPCHVQVFKQGIKSYRDLPLRLAEFGACHRYEPSGALHGLMRVRAFTQDDAHIFCEEKDIVEECKNFSKLLFEVYRDFGFTDIAIKFSDRPDNRAGDDAVWDRAESALQTAVKSTGKDFTVNKGEGAFYGPKLEYVLKDSLGRDWQCGTFQVDFILPERLDALYTDSDGKRQRPVMIHRAILGSFERFIGILIEQHAGRLPFWLAPVQVVVVAITSDVNDYALAVLQQLRDAGIRAEADCRGEKINAKIRDHSLQYVPVIAVVGKEEEKNQSLALRLLGSTDNEVLPLKKSIEKFQNLAIMKNN
ncbi:MAG: threonine--tRNA ligase [Hydrotalea sp.]|nr:threonine--tRNA ligase [Hydrotalea sp.]